MIIDSHAHLAPDVLDLDAMVAKLDAHGVDRVALIPAMNGPIPEVPERLLAVLRKAMQSAPGRALAEVVHRALMTRDGDVRISGEVVRIFPQPDNAAVADALSRYPDRFLGWIFLNPSADEHVLDTLERWRLLPGMVGVKLHPHWHDYKVDVLGPLLARCEELGLPVLIHLGFRRRGDYRHLAEAYPALPLVCAHAGFPFYRQMWTFGRRHRNLHVDLSSPYLDEALARAAVATLGADRCLYGTDAPYGFPGEDHGYDYGAIKGWVDRLPVSDAERDRILGGNFQRLLDGAGLPT